MAFEYLSDNLKRNTELQELAIANSSITDHDINQIILKMDICNLKEIKSNLDAIYNKCKEED